jgi:hypothetical protein
VVDIDVLLVHARNGFVDVYQLVSAVHADGPIWVYFEVMFIFPDLPPAQVNCLPFLPAPEEVLVLLGSHQGQDKAGKNKDKGIESGQPYSLVVRIGKQAKELDGNIAVESFIENTQIRHQVEYPKALDVFQLGCEARKSK